MQKYEKKKTYAGSKILPASIRKRRHIGPKCPRSPPPNENKEIQEIKPGAHLLSDHAHRCVKFLISVRGLEAARHHAHESFQCRPV
jgi:hypothetical protein